MSESTGGGAGLSKHRIEALADGIFAVAMTLLVLDIKMPESVSYASDADLWRRLIALEHAVASYAISLASRRARADCSAGGCGS